MSAEFSLLYFVCYTVEYNAVVMALQPDFVPIVATVHLAQETSSQFSSRQFFSSKKKADNHRYSI